jgi:hypothetical protein
MTSLRIDAMTISASLYVTSSCAKKQQLGRRQSAAVESQFLPCFVENALSDDGFESGISEMFRNPGKTRRDVVCEFANECHANARVLDSAGAKQRAAVIGQANKNTVIANDCGDL